MVEHTARQLTTVLREEYPDSLLAVGWYNGEHAQRTEVIYVAETFEALAVNAPDVLDDALLESLGREYHTGVHNEALQCTTRVYDSLIHIDIPAGERAGIVIIFDTRREPSSWTSSISRTPLPTSNLDSTPTNTPDPRPHFRCRGSVFGRRLLSPG